MPDAYCYAFDGTMDWEAAYVLPALRSPLGQKRPGWRVRTVADTTATVTTAGGLRIEPDAALSDLDPADCALLVLPGGTMWEEGGGSDATAFAARVLEAGGHVAAICGATLGLARAGLLDSRAHTSNAREYLAPSEYRGGALYRDDPAVCDERVITAGGVFPVDFASQVAVALDLWPDDVREAWYGLHKTGDRDCFDALMRALKR